MKRAVAHHPDLVPAVAVPVTGDPPVVGDAEGADDVGLTA